jgi:hypothetical protein
MMSLNKYAFASMMAATACVYHAFNTRCASRARMRPLPIRCFQAREPCLNPRRVGKKIQCVTLTP